MVNSIIFMKTVICQTANSNGADNWSFNNSRYNFGDTYYINDKYWKKLMDGLNNTEKVRINYNVKNQPFGGSCFGMAITSILANNRILNPYNWYNNANTLFKIPGPPSDEVKSLINYYFSLQFTDVVRQKDLDFIYKSEKEKLEHLVSCLKDGSPTLLCFGGHFFGENKISAHAVVAYDVEYGEYKYPQIKNGEKSKAL